MIYLLYKLTTLKKIFIDKKTQFYIKTGVEIKQYSCTEIK